MTQIKSRKLSVVLAVHNEEANLSRCLEAVKGLADEIVIVDGESTDQTVDIARAFGAKVIKTTNKAMFHTNKQMAIDAANGDWILQLDADEVVDRELRGKIEEILTEKNIFDAYWLKRKNYFLRGFLTKGGQYPDPLIRLFKRGRAHLPQKSVHEQMEVDGEIGQINGHLLHYQAPTFKRYIDNANRYTSLTAQEYKNKGIKVTGINDVKYLVWKPLATFASLFIRHRGYKDGFRGFIFALFSGLHHSISYMKLGDLYRKDGHAHRN